jgi:hypothetical protein
MGVPCQGLDAEVTTMERPTTTLPTTDDSPLRTTDLRRLRHALARALLAPFRAAGFCAAVVLPFAYLPLLYGGLTAGETGLFALAVVANIVGLVLGRNVCRDDQSD